MQVDDVRSVKTNFHVELPGTIAPVDTAQINARATGYVVERHVDIGALVKTGDVLAVIESRELEAQVAQARQALAQAESNYELAKATAARSSQLVERGYASRQKYDEDRLTETARSADVDAARAVLAQNEQRRAYLRVVAPFDGVVTQRSVETGDLVSADMVGSRPLFIVARTSAVRARVYVPQDVASTVQVGDKVEIRVPERLAVVTAGTVTRMASALNAISRTMLIEIDVPNIDNVLTPGAYVRVEFALRRDQPAVLITADSLIYNADGLQVAVVAVDGTLDLRKVAVGRDFGTDIEVRDGLLGGETIVRNPPSFLRTGQKIEPRRVRPAP